MKRFSYILIMTMSFLAFYSCKKDQREGAQEKYPQNDNSYSNSKMDSLQAINQITKQKIQELLDLSTLYASNKKGTEMDTVIYNQIKTYFLEADSSLINPIVSEIKGLNAHHVKVGKVETEKLISKIDTLDQAKFNVEYFDQNKKMIKSFDKKAIFVLKKNPVKFKQEFKFYFVNFDSKDSTSVGVTK